MPIDKAKIEEWKALAAKATPGPWRVDGPAWSEPAYIAAPEPDRPQDKDLSRVVFGPETSDEGEDADRDFILAAREALPALLAEREEREERMRVILHAGPSTALAVSVFDRAMRLEAEAKALRAKRDEMLARLRSAEMCADAEAEAGDNARRDLKEVLSVLREVEAYMTRTPAVFTGMTTTGLEHAVRELADLRTRLAALLR